LKEPGVRAVHSGTLPSGLVKRRWQPFVRDQRSVLELVLKGNFIEVMNEPKVLNSVVNEELNDGFKKCWQKYATCPLVGRNIILSSFCPQVRYYT
jgi:DNA helicase MCM9